ncbi:hypothetical protein Lal_00043664 [Lupinus albus]|nr:hypothetical protein Lal_00043664 [Lupinus albus]
MRRRGEVRRRGKRLVRKCEDEEDSVLRYPSPILFSVNGDTVVLRLPFHFLSRSFLLPFTMDSKTLNQSPPFIRFYSLRFRSGDRLTTMEVLKLVEAVEPLAAWALGNNLAPSEHAELEYQSWKSRLSEKGSPGRVKSWTILEDSRPSESCLAWARNDNFGLITQCNRLHGPCNRLHADI